MKDTLQQGRHRAGWYMELQLASDRLATGHDVDSQLNNQLADRLAEHLAEQLAEQQQEIDRQITRLSGVNEPELVIRRGGMDGHPLIWWQYVASQVAEAVSEVRIVYVD